MLHILTTPSKYIFSYFLFIKRVAVVGGGVCGLTCAYQALKTIPSLKTLDIYAEKWEGDTTSSGAAGLWRAANVGNTPREKIDRWAQGSLRLGIKSLH